MNPYWGASFFSFFQVLFSRIGKGFEGGLVSDEVQLGILSLVGLSCSLIGPQLVLKRAALFANSLSHTILLGIVAAYGVTSYFGGHLFSGMTLFLGALFAAILTALATEGLTRFCGLPEDASIGLVFTSLFALGIFLTSVFLKDAHLGIESLMGSADLLQPSDAFFPLLALLANLLFIGVFYSGLRLWSFDPIFARLVCPRGRGLSSALFLLTAITCVAAFRSVGVVLVLAFLVGPYLIARGISDRLCHLVLISPWIALFCTWVGVAISRHCLSMYALPLSTSGLIVSFMGGVYLLTRLRRKDG